MSVGSRAPRLPRGPRRSEDGFTLVEVLVAVIVLAVGILGAARLVASSEASTLDAELQQLATEEAEQAVEDVRALDYEAIGHATGNPANNGDPWQAPAATAAEDIVIAASGTGVLPTRSFSVQRGGGKPPVTGTIETYVTWRDEECSLLDVSDIEALQLLATRLTALEAQLVPLLGVSGLIPEIAGNLTDQLILVIPNGQRPAYYQLRTELNALLPVLNTTASEIDRAQALLAAFEGLEIDLCDLEPADLAGLQDLLSFNSSLLVDLTEDLAGVEVSLDALSQPLSSLLGYITSLGTAVCGLLPQPNICGVVTSLTNDALHEVLPSGNPEPRELATEVNAVLAGFDIDLDGLTKDTTHNTKRVTVAVTIETPGDAAPANPVWASSVVTDPVAGLLFQGGL
jgi:prepilin-type N-terminal cleavage/methylation domain-containing protein